MKKSITDISSRDKHNLHVYFFPGHSPRNASKRACVCANVKDVQEGETGENSRGDGQKRETRVAPSRGEPEAIGMNPVSPSGLLRSLVMFDTERGRRWEKGGRVAYQRAPYVARIVSQTTPAYPSHHPPPSPPCPPGRRMRRGSPRESGEGEDSGPSSSSRAHAGA